MPKPVRESKRVRITVLTVQNGNISKSYQLFKKTFEKDSCRQTRAKYISVSIYFPSLKNT